MATMKDYYDSLPEDYKAMTMPDGPTFKGRHPNQGEIDLCPYEGEGYAVLSCGGTSVKIGYSLLSKINVLAEDRLYFSHLVDLQAAIDSITCEAELQCRYPFE